MSLSPGLSFSLSLYVALFLALSLSSSLALELTRSSISLSLYLFRSFSSFISHKNVHIHCCSFSLLFSLLVCLSLNWFRFLYLSRYLSLALSLYPFLSNSLSRLSNKSNINQTNANALLARSCICADKRLPRHCNDALDLRQQLRAF